MSVLDPPSDPPSSTAAILRREGDYWTLAYERRLVRMRDAKGLHYIERLLANPGRELTVEELSACVGASAGRSARNAAGDAERDRKAVTNRIRQAIGRIGNLHSGLGRHLRNSVRTGGRCIYTPERLVRWNGVEL